MTDQDWRRVSKGLVVVLAVLVLGVVAVVILRPGDSGTSGTPSAGSFIAAGGSPSAGLGASPTSETGASTGASPLPGTSPSPSRKPTASASRSPTPTAAAPLRSIKFLHVGIDGQSATTPTRRILTFVSDGPGQVTATLGQTSAGEVRFCLYTGDKPAGNQCRTTSKATLTGTATATDTTRWHVSLLGLDLGTSPIADVKLEFRSNAPRVTVDGFRMQGNTFPDYNGVSAQFKVGAGDVVVNGSWSGATRPWRVRLLSAQSGENAGSSAGTGNNGSLRATVIAGGYQLTFENTEGLADQEVFLHAVIRWP